MMYLLAGGRVQLYGRFHFEEDPIKTNAVPEHQTFTITPNGTLAVIKAGFFVARGTNTQIRLERMPQ